MTFPLGSLGAEAGAAMAPGNAPTSMTLRQQLWLMVAAVAWLLMVLAMLTHSGADAGFSTSGSGGAPTNKAGMAGAWFSDFLFFMLGHSAWWLPVVAARSWLSALARQLRGQAAPQGQ